MFRSASLLKLNNSVSQADTLKKGFNGFIIKGRLLIYEGTYLDE